jgi:tetratricopeptide (TPR) repeat protein
VSTNPLDPRLRRPARFLNRDAQLRLIADHVGLLGTVPSHLKVFEVRGFGGVGKTRLLQELQRRSDELPGVNPIAFVPLRPQASVTEAGPLKVIREKLDYDCLLFDTALMLYLHVTGQPFKLGRSSRIRDSTVFRTLDVGRSMSGLPVPLPLAAELYDKIARKATEYLLYDRAEFDALSELRDNPAQLLNALPRCLALDLRRRLEVDARAFIAFYDEYDRQAPETVAAHAPWLRTFIETLGRGVHVIATREPLRWEGALWRDLVEPVLVDLLPEDECREMVRGRLTSLGPGVEDRMIEASRRIPFFLETIINVYEQLVSEQATVSAGDLPLTPEGSVAHLLEHLPEQQRSLAIALAAVQVFDEGLYRQLIRSLNLQVEISAFQRFIRWFFVDHAEPGLYKTHDLLTEFVRTSTSARPTAQLALEAATDSLYERSDHDRLIDADTTLQLFRSVGAGWFTQPTMPLASTETFIDAGLRLYDAGYWNELSMMLPAASPTVAHPMMGVVEFFAALSARRTAGIDRALELFEPLENRAAVLGRHMRSVELEVAYLSELAGNYASARQEFRELNRLAVPFKVNDRTHLRARLHHADMLMMDGELRAGSRLLLEAYEEIGPRAPMDWAEFVRHRGHAFRFSFLLEQAHDLYSSAVRAAANARALVGKLQTNLAETLCWVDAERALEAAQLSTLYNDGLGNEIELAKCDAAKAISLAKLGEFAAARDAVATATQRARRVGYPAGQAFAMQAMAVVEHLDGNPEAVARCSADLDNAVLLLGTYTHLRIVPAWLMGNDEVFIELALGCDWLEPDDLEDRLRAVFGPPGPSA